MKVHYTDSWDDELFDEERLRRFGRTNQSRKYRLNGRTLKSAVEQRDLGIQIRNPGVCDCS